MAKRSASPSVNRPTLVERAGRPWNDYEASALPRILEASLEAFAEVGFEATSIRDIAGKAGLSVPGVYHHYRSKQEILFRLVQEVMNDLLTRSRDALEATDGSPDDRFEVLVDCMLRFHMRRQAEASVAFTELRSLKPSFRKVCVGLRDRQQSLVNSVIDEGCAAGYFTTPFPRDAARAVSSLCVGVASWYREDGPRSQESLVARQLVLLRALIGAAP